MLKKVEDKSFFESLRYNLSLYRKRITTKKLKQKHIVVWFQHYEEGITVDNLAEYYNQKSKSTFTNSYKASGWFAIFKEELLGHLTEETLTIDYYRGFKVIGGNTEPNMVNDDVMVEVKARHRREKPNIRMFNEKELSHLKKGGKLELVLVTFKPSLCVLEFYSVLNN